MRTRLLALLAVGAIAVPAAATHAEAPQRGISKGNIIFNYTGEVLPGQEEALKQLVPKLIAAVQQEPGTMAYEWSMRADGKHFRIPWRFSRNSNAVVAHVKDVVTNYGGDLGKTTKGATAGRFWQSGCGGEKGDRGLQIPITKPRSGASCASSRFGYSVGSGSRGTISLFAAQARFVWFLQTTPSRYQLVLRQALRLRLGSTVLPLLGAPTAPDGQPDSFHTQMDARLPKPAFEEGVTAVAATDRTGGAATHFC